MDAAENITAIGRDPDALEAFYREHLESVQRFVARRVHHPEDAADLTAEVFLAAIHAASSYRGDAAAPRAWLYGIARRVVAGHHRTTARTERALASAAPIAARDLLDEDSTERIASRIDSERDARGIYRELADLPESQRAVVELVAVDGLSLIEAAAALSISPGNARVRYHRARRRLTQNLPRPVTEHTEVNR